MEFAHRVQNDRRLVFAVTILTAIGHLIGVVSAGVYAGAIETGSASEFLASASVYVIVGGFLLGALPGYLLARKRLVTPLVSGVFFFHLAIGKWLYGSPGIENPEEHFYVYRTLWPIIVVFLIGIGTIEYVARGHFRRLFQNFSRAHRQE